MKAVNGQRQVVGRATAALSGPHAKALGAHQQSDIKALAMRSPSVELCFCATRESASQGGSPSILNASYSDEHADRKARPAQGHKTAVQCMQ